MELKPFQNRSDEEELAYRLARLDGINRYAFLLWRFPDTVDFDRINLKHEPKEYVQCAGGISGRFICEIRAASPDGFQQLVVGRRIPEVVTGERLEGVAWDGHETLVRASEVLHLEEVIEVFQHYLASGEIPPAYVTRVQSW